MCCGVRWLSAAALGCMLDFWADCICCGLHIADSCHPPLVTGHVLAQACLLLQGVLTIFGGKAGMCLLQLTRACFYLNINDCQEALQLFIVS